MAQRSKNTSISISEENWKKLNNIKQLGETFDDVISQLLKTRELRQ